MYLLPEYEDPTSQQEVLEKFWPALFEAMLGGWVNGRGVLAQEPNAADVPGVVEFDGSGSRRLHASGADLTRGA